jgi:hypothetical protein
VGRRYVQYFNTTYKRSGTLWEGCYRATVVDSERYLLTVMRYIELNPVRAGLVTDPGSYPWSSYRQYALGESGPNAHWLTPHPEYLKLGQSEPERQLAYRELFRAAIADADLAAIRDCTHKGWALGSERFKEQIEALGQRRAASKGAGRPRKEENRDPVDTVHDLRLVSGRLGEVTVLEGGRRGVSHELGCGVRCRGAERTWSCPAFSPLELMKSLGRRVIAI